MEMEQLTQKRQLILYKHNLKMYKEEATKKLDKMSIIFEIKEKESEEKVKQLKGKLEYYKNENARLNSILNEKEEESNQMRLCQNAGVGPLLDIVNDF